MNRGTEALAPADFERLAALHAQSLPESTLSRLGAGYLASAYRYFERSPSEQLFTLRAAGRIDSACVLSFAPATLTRRLALHTGLLPRVLRHIFEPAVRRAVFDCSGGPSFDCPEVVFIFSDPASRGLGYGAKLLAQCEAALRQAGSSRYLIKTLDGDANPAIRFYEREGFTERGRFTQYGTKFRWMDKAL